MTTTTWIGLLLGALAVGILIGWLVAANRATAARRSADIELARGHAELEGARRDAAGLREQLDAAREDSDRRVAQARAEGEARLREVKADQDAERQRFQSVAGEALAANSKQFLDLAQQTLRASTTKNEEVLAQREQAFRALVEPLNKSLEKVQTQVTDAEAKRREGQSQLSEHLRQLELANADLRKGTSDLVTALRSSQTRGAWGELQLRRVVEAAGMLRNVDFVEQASVATDDGTLRPDMVVRLAGGKSVVVDAKVAFVGYLEAQQAQDPAVREARLDAHVRHMRKHVEDLAEKRYWNQFDPAPEFVVMFVPAEVFLSAAAERDPALLEDAVRKNVIIATPMTMVALLRTVAYAWRQDALARNAQEVLRVGKELHGRLVTMTKHITATGAGLERATKSYNSMIASLERNVLTSARRMVALDVVDEKDAIEEVKGIEEVPRPITKSELLAAEEERVVSIESIAALDQKALQAVEAPDDEAAAG
ncbi:DNA recombination protein RmuC [Xylanimonas ulmi]|uniref:DNA recombination protein RmuC n=1 Tax=Xylanimonas ulmi TaxID=228973 RepID=A0A4Q7M4E0_9MICO|nr:DNA recombination protein RmuC [Xylanibacterium ulmi]RZS61787.1 DNA recombination protein RmuC [Xylanibacterium ulmi]